MAILPLIVPPAFGKAALAVVVVLVKTASLVAISTPSTVPVTVIFPVTSTPEATSKLPPTVTCPVACARNTNLSYVLSVL